MSSVDDKLKAWSKIKHFAPSEFDSPDVEGSGLLMNLEFVVILDCIREDVKFPLFITSGYRTPHHNAKVSKIEKSEHTTGNAVDIACTNGTDRMKLVRSALSFGIKRIGIADNFIHLGMSFDLPQSVIWVY